MARPSGNPGDAADGAGKVHQAVDLLEQALTKIPLGHEGHAKIMSAISSLGKAFPPGSATNNEGQKKQALIQMLAQMQKASPLAALGGGAGPGGPPGGAEGGAPPMPMMPPGGGAAPPM